MSNSEQDSAAQAPTPYDLVPYPSSSFPQSHPNRLAAMAKLFGLNPAAPSSARVLELGCADGANILPMADSAPGSKFLGLDASKVQIAAGQKAVAEAGLTNVELRCQDFMDFPASEGKFDYIVVHGIFSWVPDAVREKILAICEQHLAENGIAYISYNALPGWNMKRSLRDMIQFHTGPLQDPQVKVRQARALIKFLSDSVPTENNAYGIMLKNELEAMSKQADNYLLHDIMEEENTAFYFHDFIARAARHGLQYVSEPNLSQMLATNFTGKVRETLAKIGAGIVAQEQYMDFLRNRTFRQTLLCRAGLPMKRNLDRAQMRNFSFQSLLKRMDGPVDLKPEVEVEFTMPRGSKINTKDSFVKAMLYTLSQSPAAISFDELLTAARQQSRPLLGQLPADRAAVEEGMLLINLMNLCAKGFLELWAEPVAVATKVPEKPTVSGLMRYQALNARHITNRLHQPLPGDDMARQVMAACDGTRTIHSLMVHVLKCVQQGKLQVTAGNAKVTDPKRLETVLGPLLNTVLARMVELGFVAP